MFEAHCYSRLVVFVKQAHGFFDRYIDVSPGQHLLASARVKDHGSHDDTEQRHHTAWNM